MLITIWLLFWILCTIGVGWLTYRNTHEGMAVFVLVVIFLSICGICHSLANRQVIWQTPLEIDARYIESVKELPIQQLMFEGRVIDVVVLSNTVTRANSDDLSVNRGLVVRRVSDCVPYNVLPDTKLYLVTERDRLWWCWMIFGQKTITDKVPNSINNGNSQ